MTGLLSLSGRILVALALLLWLVAGATAQEPTPTPTPISQDVPPASPSPSPPGPFGPRRVQWLRLNTVALFSVAGTERMTARERVRQVQERLREALRRNNNEVPAVRVDEMMGSTVVVAGDQVLITVLKEDLQDFDVARLEPAERNRLERELAERWREALQQELERSAVMQTPAYRWFALSLVGIVLVLTLVVHRLIRYFTPRPLWSVKFLLWTLSLLICLRLFPQTQMLAEKLYEGVLWPFILLLLVVIVTGAAINLTGMLVRRYFLALQRAQQPLHLSRLGQRMSTLDQACQFTTRVLLFLAGGLTYLTLLQIDLRPILAGAGLVGVALGFATQDLLKDVVAGVNILLEDSFGVGDVIEWGTLTGTVEAFSMRSTRVRTIDGRLVTIPNSELRIVQNHSNRWSRVDFQVEVAYRTDLDRALAVLCEEATRLSEEWPERILEPPVVLGVDRLGNSGVVLRLLVQTRPLSQWEVRRELNRRVKNRFDLEEIEIPFPQQKVWLEPQAALKGSAN